MRKLFILLLLCILQLSGLAQYSADKPYNEIGRKPGLMRHYTLMAPTETSPERFDRLNTDFFFNNWLGERNGVATKFYSIGHAVNLMFDIPFSKTSRLGIAVGLGYTHYSVRHNGDFDYETQTVPQIPEDNFSVLEPYSGPNRWINRTVFNQVDIPFELRIRSRKERGKFKFYPGFKVGYIFDSFEKWRQGKFEYKTFNFPDLNRFQYGPTVRIGIDNVFLFGSYNMSYMFTNEQSSDLNLFSVGISFGWF